MTGEKNRYSTVEKLWKLDDTSLKTPKHDEMVIWLLNSENVAKVIPRVYTFLNKATSTVRANPGIIFGERHTNFLERVMTGKKELEKQEVTILKAYFNTDSEEAVQQMWNDQILMYHKEKTNFDKNHKSSISLESEVPLMARNGFLVGYWDLVISPFLGSLRTDHFFFEWDKSFDIPKLYVEVKSKIDSFGATLRQLRTYQEYERNAIGNTYLFTSDLRFKEAFESQGIHVISPP